MNQYRPKIIKMEIHSGILEALGINMYTSIAKSLVEFIANAFDADATRVDIKIPFSEIQHQLKLLKNKHSKDIHEVFSNEALPLPDKIEITIEDDGHGMKVEEMEEKFLPISRNRRKTDGSKSESGKRIVMGRKGLGKLAGFGAAKRVSVRSTRKGENYATKIVMDFEEIEEKSKINDVKILPEYEDCLVDEHGTKITLQMIRGDSVRSSEKIIKSTIARNFSIAGEGFEIYLNDELIEEEKAEYVFCYPENDPNKLIEVDIPVDEKFSYPILYNIKFREKSLPAAMRGARVYCNQRLAAGPTLLDLASGTHNFHAHSYMECIVHADVLDEGEIDLIGTNRSDIKTDNLIVEAFRKEVTRLMKDALKEHGKFREEEIDKKLKSDPTSKAVLESISVLSSKHQGPARTVLKALALSSKDGVEGKIFQEVAPMFVRAINSSEILVELIKTEIAPKDMVTVIDLLSNLAEIENSDIIKLYKGRYSAILGLEKLQEKTHERSSAREEKQIHELLKKNPWLIKPEYSRFLTSNQTLSTTAKELTSVLEIDAKAPMNAENDRKRPDLVFVATDPSEKSHICIIELKAPNKPLEDADLHQLEGYMAMVENWFTRNNTKPCKVTGCLIGNLNPALTSNNAVLNKRLNEAGPDSDWEILTVHDLLTRAKQIHHASIEILEKAEEEHIEILEKAEEEHDE